jgi:peptide/nickel transport system permease protein
MTAYIVRRVLHVIPVLLVASVVLFVALHVLPGDPARQLLGKQATEQQVEVKRHELGLDRPLVAQYWDWLNGLPQGDLGETFGAAQPVSQLVARALPVTLQLALIALLIAFIVSLPIALISALRPGGWLDSGLTAVSVATTAVPTFVWGLFGVLLFSISLRWLPSSGYVGPFTDPVVWAKSMVMPCIALAMPTIGTLSRVARSALLETLDEPYVQFARSKGISRWRLYVGHALKNASVPIIVVAGAEFAYILGDAVVVETVFSLPGMGKLMIDSFLNRDYAVIQGVAIVYTVLVVISGLIADLVSAELDPRVRLTAQTA